VLIRAATAVDTSSAPAASTADVGAAAAVLAELIVEATFAKSVAAAVTYSGSANTKDIPTSERRGDHLRIADQQRPELTRR
jgi:formate hydrogenlyase subunit 4